MTPVVVLYLGAIVAANVTTAALGPYASIVNSFVLIAFDLTARDRLHAAWDGPGRHLWRRMFALIAAGGVLAYLVNRSAGPVALASCIAFAAASLTDALIYARVRGNLRRRANASNAGAAVVDSIIFPTLAFGGFALPVVLWQITAKIAGGWLWARVLIRRRAAPAR